MLELKGFIHAACLNIRYLLDSVQRFEYADHIDESVFLALQTRISAIEQNIGCADLIVLKEISKNLSGVAATIAQVEKSHLGEISWGFVDHFAPLAKSVCVSVDSLNHGSNTSNTSVPSDGPKDKILKKLKKHNEVCFFFSSSDVLSGYKLLRENSDSEGVGFHRDYGGARVFNLQFPRAFKESVLLHGLLAHEVGHALLAVGATMWRPLIREAFRNSPLSLEHYSTPEKNISTFLANNAPDQALRWMAAWTNGMNLGRGATVADVQSITDEIFCDLVGLLLIGPSFIFALTQLLWTFHSTDEGESQLPSYPPFRIRIATLVNACESLKWSNTIDKNAWRHILDHAFFNVSKGDILNKNQVGNLIHKIKEKILNYSEDILYSTPNREIVEQVKKDLRNKKPPSDRTLRKDHEGLTITNHINMDFRDVLLAAWECAVEGCSDNLWHERFNNINILTGKALVNLLGSKNCNRGVTS
jgi:hypothetical protein